MKRRGLESLSSKILKRECLAGPAAANTCRDRRFFENIVPDTAIRLSRRVGESNLSFFRFSPCGQYLLAFDLPAETVVVFQFKGVFTNSEIKLNTVPFEDVFQELYRIRLAQEPDEHLLPFCLDVQGLYFIFASTRVRPEEARTPHSTRVQKTTFHLVKIVDGQCMDAFTIENDFIEAWKNNGVTLFDNTLVVLGLESQTLFVLSILLSTGQFLLLRKIGRYCREDDELIVTHQEREEKKFIAQRNVPKAPSHPELAALVPLNNRMEEEEEEEEEEAVAEARLHEVPPLAAMDGHSSRRSANLLDGLKQCLLTRLLSDAENESKKQKFFYYYESYLNLTMTSAHMLDNERILLNWVTSDNFEDGVSYRSMMHRFQRHKGILKAIYNIQTARFEFIFNLFGERASALQEWIQFCRNFHWMLLGGVPSTDWDRYTSLPVTKTGTSAEELSRMLPWPCQMIQSSPYLDPQIYQWDERLINPLLQSYKVPQRPLKFTLSSRPEKLRFRLDPEDFLPEENPQQAPMLFEHEASYIYHPRLPFILVLIEDETSGSVEHITAYVRLD